MHVQTVVRLQLGLLDALGGADFDFLGVVFGGGIISDSLLISSRSIISNNLLISSSSIISSRRSSNLTRPSLAIEAQKGRRLTGSSLIEGDVVVELLGLLG